MSRQWVLGDHSLVLISFADNVQALTDVSNASWRDLAACGLVATRMQKALQAAYLSMLPGGRQQRAGAEPGQHADQQTQEEHQRQRHGPRMRR